MALFNKNPNEAAKKLKERSQPEGSSDKSRKVVTMHTLNDYKNDVIQYGLQKTWEIMFQKMHTLPAETFNIESFGELYEIGLETLDKVDKKEHGKYYTPYDVAAVMSEWLKTLPGENVCDVCCGTGNLILAYFDVIGQSATCNLLENEHVWLFDLDETAMYICKKTIGLKYGIQYEDKIHCIQGDFLNREMHLPPNCKVISNPPYFKITQLSANWDVTPVIAQSKEFYAAIMEKIFKESEASVIITPYSFIGGQKFAELRKIMNNQSGTIHSFDNVPGCIFNGRKHGIFNTNTTNSVRAAITVTNSHAHTTGYQVSPLIRFKSIEREQILNVKVLESMLPKTKQMANALGFAKCHTSLEDVLKVWQRKSGKHTMQELTNNQGQYMLCVPNSCRYFTVATKRELNRCGKHTLRFKTEENMLLAYVFLNSSLCYWHWRLYDGGINYSYQLLSKMPIFIHQCTAEQKEMLCSIAREMIDDEQKYLSYKKNANQYQETVKFPATYRQRLNQALCDVLGIKADFTILHSNITGGITHEE